MNAMQIKSKSIMLFISALFVPVVSFASERWQGVFSDMEFSSESGDVTGMEIIISSTNAGYYAVVQTSEGEPCPPVVAPVVVRGGTISIDLPASSCYVGRIVGKMTESGLSLSFTGGALSPHGEAKFTLPRAKSYWEK